MKFPRQLLFTLIGFAAAVAVLGVEKIGDFFLLAPPDKYYIDLIVSALLVTAGILLDINLWRLAREKKVEKELRVANAELARTNSALKESLAKIRVLKGLLPICASCKKIRDDKGYWQQVDVYFHEHSDAEFTHWLCPECVDKLWSRRGHSS